MIVQITRLDLGEAVGLNPLLVKGTDISGSSVYLDLEHYIYRKPICIGIFGAAVIEGQELVCTQYFLENKADLKGLIGAAHDYLQEKRQAGYKHLVTFAGQNDLLMIHAMFLKFKIETDLRTLFESVDLQSIFKQEFHGIVGLTALEQFAGIFRGGPEISGSTIAKTFASVMADPSYIRRMPQEKIYRLLAYNQMDVENLYYIMMNWSNISKTQVQEYLDSIKRRNNLTQLNKTED